MLEEPPTDLPLADVKTGHSVVKPALVNQLRYQRSTHLKKSTLVNQSRYHMSIHLWKSYLSWIVVPIAENGTILCVRRSHLNPWKVLKVEYAAALSKLQELSTTLLVKPGTGLVRITYQCFFQFGPLFGSLIPHLLTMRCDGTRKWETRNEEMGNGTLYF